MERSVSLGFFAEENVVVSDHELDCAFPVFDHVYEHLFGFGDVLEWLIKEVEIAIG
jgi:hypothetical protein